jgi:hypothetical protein
MNRKYIDRNYKVIRWDELLLESKNPNVVPFLKWNGDEFIPEFVNVIKTLYNKSIELNKKHKNDVITYNAEMAVHVNCDYLITFTETDFEHIFDFCISYYEKLEHYEKCAELSKLKNKICNTDTVYSLEKKPEPNVSSENTFNKFF